MLKKGEYYKARNGNIGLYSGRWMITASGIYYILEDEKGHVVGYISKKYLMNNLKKQ